jgi:hypothetical protein
MDGRNEIEVQQYRGAAAKERSYLEEQQRNRAVTCHTYLLPLMIASVFQFLQISAE